MANYEATARTNYFKVVDEEKFKAYCERYEFELITKKSEDGGQLHGFLVTAESGVPSTYFDPEQDADVEADPLGELSEHLVPGQVAVFMEVGHEKACFLNGFAYATNSKGEIATINLHEIMERASTLGEHITKCEL